LSEVFEIGGIKTKLIVDTDDAIRNIAEGKKEFQGLYTTVETLPPALQKLVAQQQKVAQQMQEQREKAMQLDVALDKARQQFVAADKAMGQLNDNSLEKHFEKEIAALDKENAKIEELANQYKLLEKQKAQYIANSAQSAASAQGAQQYKDMSMGMSKLYQLVNGVLAGTQAFSARAHEAMVSRTGGTTSSVSTSTKNISYNIDKIEINHPADAMLVMAQLSALEGGVA